MSSSTKRSGGNRSSGAARDSEPRTDEDGTVEQGVIVDDDAQAKRQPVTVIVSPAGNHYDADTWSDANNLLSMGYSIAPGYPTGPGDVPAASADTPAVESGAADPAAGTGGSDTSSAAGAGGGESSSSS